MPHSPDLITAMVLRVAQMHALYRMFDANGQLLYVGITGKLLNRLDQHAEKRWFPLVASITLEWFPKERDAREAERRAIAIEHPVYNIAGRLPPGTPVFDASPPWRPKRRRKGRTGPRMTSEFPEAARSRLMTFLADQDGITISHAAAELRVTKWVARVWLEQLRKEGAVRLDGRNRGARWRLAALPESDAS